LGGRQEFPDLRPGNFHPFGREPKPPGENVENLGPELRVSGKPRDLFDLGKTQKPLADGKPARAEHEDARRAGVLRNAPGRDLGGGLLVGQRLYDAPRRHENKLPLPLAEKIFRLRRRKTSAKRRRGKKPFPRRPIRCLGPPASQGKAQNARADEHRDDRAPRRGPNVFAGKDEPGDREHDDEKGRYGDLLRRPAEAQQARHENPAAKTAEGFENIDAGDREPESILGPRAGHRKKEAGQKTDRGVHQK